MVPTPFLKNKTKQNEKSLGFLEKELISDLVKPGPYHRCRKLGITQETTGYVKGHRAALKGQLQH